MTTVLANGSPAAGYTFDAVGNLQTLRYGNGVTNVYQYDARNRLTNLVWNTGGTVDPARQYTLMMLQTGSARKRKQLWENLLLSLARDLVPLRPGRREPRALKRRPKPFPLLTKPRHRFREIEHRNRHWKGKPRNYRALN